MENTVVQEEKKPSMVKKVLSIVFNSLFYLVILLLLVFSISNLVGKDKNAPSIFGYYFMSVESGSMEGTNKDSFTTKDLIITKKATERTVSKLKIGDIVTYEGAVNGNRSFISHRIVDIVERNGVGKVFILQGDYLQGTERQYNKEAYESDDDLRLSYLSTNVVQELREDQIIAIYQTKWTNFGSTMKFLRSQTGFALVIILPTGVLLAVEVFFLIRNLTQLNKEKVQKQFAEKDEEAKRKLEEERERMRQELLAEMAKEKETPSAENKEEEETQEETAE